METTKQIIELMMRWGNGNNQDYKIAIIRTFGDEVLFYNHDTDEYKYISGETEFLEELKKIVA